MGTNSRKSLEQGKKYRVCFSSGEVEHYIFKGLGEYMKQQWENAATGEVIFELPPHILIEQID